MVADHTGDVRITVTSADGTEVHASKTDARVNLNVERSKQIVDEKLDTLIEINARATKLRYASRTSAERAGHRRVTGSRGE